MKLILILVTSIVLLFSASNAQAATSTSGVAVGYWTHTWLTGCVAPGRCVMACGGYLNDNNYTVATNPRWGLGCGQRLRICQKRCVIATVTDRTASFFDFEFTYALSLALGQPKSNWAGPRTVRWSKYYRRALGPSKWSLISHSCAHGPPARFCRDWQTPPRKERNKI